jgi:hypothetical protein
MRDLVIGPGHQDDAVGLQALVLAARQFALDGACWSISTFAQAVARRAALAETQLDQAALAGEHLGRQLPAVFAGHGALDALDDGGHRRAVVLELLGAVGDLDAGAAADVLVIGALVGVLEPAPAADVVDQDDLEVGLAGLDVLDQLLQGDAAVDAQAALAFVGVGADDLDAAPAAYSRILSPWFSVEYCWCSVDMRTYSPQLAALALALGSGAVALVGRLRSQREGIATRQASFDSHDRSPL